MKHHEHLARSQAHRALLLVESKKPAGQGNFPEGDDWHTVDVYMTCHTSGCIMDGVHNPGRCADNVDGLFRAHCGHCQQEIHDIVGLFDDGPVRLEHWDSAKHGPKKK